MFFGNPRLRGTGEHIEMTKEEMKEWLKCSQDIFHFATYFYINAADGMHPIKLRPYQEKIVQTLIANVPNKNNRIIMQGRQTGKTTIATLYLTWLALFRQNKTIAVLANKEAQAIEIMSRIKDAYVNLPLWLQQGINKDVGGWTKGCIGLDNGTKIFAAASSSSSIRGKTVDYMLVDEFAHLDANIAEDFMMSVFPTQASRLDSKLILISTPKGMNHFYDIWMKAVNNQNSFIPCKVQWNEIEGRDDEWRARMIKDNGPVFFAQEYACLHGNEEVEIQHPDGAIEKIKIKDLYHNFEYAI